MNVLGRRHAPIPRRVATIVAALALALLLVACDDDPDIDTGAVDAEALLEAAATEMDQVQSFRFVLEHENGAPEIVQGLRMESAEGAVADPERMQVALAAAAGPLNVEVEVIVLPDESWMTNPLTGRWERETIALDDLFDPSSGVTGIMRLIEGAEVTGGEQVDGVETYVIEATVDSGDLEFLAAGAEPGREIPARAWIGVDEPLVHQLEVQGAVGEGEADDLVRRLTLSDFGAEIVITAPR